MKKYTSLLLTAICLFCNNLSFAQTPGIVGTNAFFAGQWLEVGEQSNGDFGCAASSVPAGYHQHCVGCANGNGLDYVYDFGHDGWTVGSPAYMGDYTYPGSPFEGWEIQFGATGSAKGQAFCIGGTTGTYTNVGGAGLTGAITSFTDIGGRQIATWSGTASGGNLQIIQQTEVDTFASWILMTVKLYNIGTTAIDSIYYLRSNDPDNNETWAGSAAYTTENYIDYQNDVDHRVQVRASSSTPAPGDQYPFALCTKDSRAVAFIYGEWPMSSTQNLTPVWDKTYDPGDTWYNVSTGSAVTEDIAIGLIFNIGTIFPGDSASFSYAYTFNGISGIDSAFPVSCSGTPVAGNIISNSPTACTTTTVTLTDTGSTALASYQWQSSPDSITWSNIVGANAATYTFSGMSATTYFRTVVSCTTGGASDTTAGIKFTYTTVCPCVLVSAGTVTANVPYACSTATVTLTDAGYAASAATLQWQSSPDSTTWANIPGATLATYTFIGLAATTYYRLNVLCISGGGSIASPGIKIPYSTTCICTGTPDAGTATASTTSCSSCSLTLSLTGASLADSLKYQWQSSPTGIAPWTNIAGATTVPYTFTPYGTYYYRCEVTCIPSATSAYSSGIEVFYDYHIIAHSVSNTPDTVCAGSDFYIEVNGVSSLLRVKTYYGDGTTDSVALTSGTTTAAATVAHIYSWPGHYTVKQVVYWNNVPQDSVTFSYEYYYCRTLPVKLFIDLNADCIKESTEPYNATSVLMQVDSNGIVVDTISATSGLYYNALGLPGTIYSFSIIPGALIASCASSAIIYDTITSTVNTYPVKYYGLSCSGSGFDLAVTDAAPVTGPHDQIGYIYVWNNLCDIVNGTVTVYYDKRYSSSFNMRGGSMAPVSQTDTSATWNISGLASAASPVELNYQVWAPSGSLAQGDTVYSRVTVSPTLGDVDILNNIEIINDTINDCEDPNQIFVSPSGCLRDTVTRLQYTILFTNVGTDTAFNVYVMDTLPNTLDPKSLLLIMASNTMNIAQYNDGGYNIVKFDFPGINLLDTNVCPQCSGQVVFNINTLAGLPEGTTIFNHAGVFFDDNPVVLTDTSENIMGGCTPASVNNSPKPTNGNVSIFPNPTTTQLSIIMSPSAYTSFTITNSIGQDMIQQSLTTTQTQVNVATLPPGLYYITFRGDNGTTVQKFVKM